MWDGGPVNNLGQVLHRCPALGGQEVVPAAQGSSPADGPLLVGDRRLPAWLYLDKPVLGRAVVHHCHSIIRCEPHASITKCWSVQVAIWTDCRT